MKLCLMQAKAGRKFMNEQPVGASAWRTQLMNKLLFVTGAEKVNFDSRMLEKTSAKEGEVTQARQRTRNICNSRNWRATACQVYNDESCKTVCETIMKEKNNLDYTSGVLGRLSLGLTEAKEVTRTMNEVIKVEGHVV